MWFDDYIVALPLRHANIANVSADPPIESEFWMVRELELTIIQVTIVLPYSWQCYKAMDTKILSSLLEASTIHHLESVTNTSSP